MSVAAAGKGKGRDGVGVGVKGVLGYGGAMVSWVTWIWCMFQGPSWGERVMGLCTDFRGYCCEVGYGMSRG